MITELDLQEAIAECQGVRNPTASTCIKLAAFLTIQRELFGSSEQSSMVPSYSFAPGPAETTIDYDSGTEFSEAIQGKDPADVYKVMDEVMDTLKIINARVYNSVMRKLTN